MSFDVLRDKAKMAQVDVWLADDAAEKLRAEREDQVREYIRRFFNRLVEHPATDTRRP